MAAPDGGSGLAARLAALRGQGFDVLVCALTDAELAELGLATEAAAARRAGLAFVRVPIDDFGVPRPALLPAITELAGQFTTGARLVVHCRAGIGRSGLLAAAILVLAGHQPGAALTMIGNARGRPVPETAAQRAWVHALGPPHSPP
jgi:protein-tyrosine phosphatase